MVFTLDMPYHEIGWGTTHVEDMMLVTATGAVPLSSGNMALRIQPGLIRAQSVICRLFQRRGAQLVGQYPPRHRAHQSPCLISFHVHVDVLVALVHALTTRSYGAVRGVERYGRIAIDANAIADDIDDFARLERALLRKRANTFVGQRLFCRCRPAQVVLRGNVRVEERISLGTTCVDLLLQRPNGRGVSIIRA